MTPTPGQIAYEAYWRAFTPHLDLLPWDGLSANNRDAWEAAAQAVLAQTTPPRMEAWPSNAASQDADPAQASAWIHAPEEETL